MKRYQGSLLIEVSIAAGVAAIGMFTVFLTFTQARRESTRQALIASGLNAIATQVDADSKVPFSQLTDTNPPIITINTLPQAALTRSIQSSSPNTAPIKRIHYILTWQGFNGIQTIASDYILTENGLANTKVGP